MKAAFQSQADICAEYGSPFTAALLRRAADWLESGHPVAERLRHWPGTGSDDAVPLRFAGAVQALALSGLAPAVASGIDAGADAANLWPEITAALDAHAEWVDHFIDSPPQTNEVGRSAVLMSAALELAARYALPFRWLEAGASAGLNTVFDRYRYGLGGRAAGDPASPVLIEPDWRGIGPPAAKVDVVERAACDIAPLDVANEDDRLRLRSYVWIGQTDRAAKLKGALAAARDESLKVEQNSIGDWLARVLAHPHPGRLTVLAHTVVWMYLGDDERARAEDAIPAAGTRATDEAPLARVAMEWNPDISAAEVRVTAWPGGESRLLGLSHAHGAWIEWKGWKG